MEIIWYWAWGSAVKYTSLQTPTNKRTIISWFSKIRDYLYAEFLEAPPLGGNDYEWQIDVVIAARETMETASRVHGFLEWFSKKNLQ